MNAKLHKRRLLIFPIFVTIITAVVVTWCVSLPLPAPVGYVKDVQRFITRLTNQPDSVSLFVWTNLDADTRQTLIATNITAAEKAAKLDQRLGMIVASQWIYETNRFAAVQLSEATKSLLGSQAARGTVANSSVSTSEIPRLPRWKWLGGFSEDPDLESVVRLNWLLLKDTYTNELYLTAVKPWDKQAVRDFAENRGIKLWRSEVTTEQKDKNQPSKPEDSTYQSKVEKAFGYQLKQYEQSLDALQTNFYMQTAFILFGLFLLFSKEDPIEIPVIGLKLHRNWLYFVVPLALLFLWLRFGFLLDTLIKTRLYAWELFQQWAGTPVTKEFLRSGAALLEDSGYMDGWFGAFRQPDEHLIDQNFQLVSKWLIFPVVFGVLLGANHGSIVAISHLGYARLSPQELKSRSLRRILKWLPTGMFLTLLFSHLLFFFGGPNPNWFQILVPALGITFMFLLILLWQPREMHQSLARESVANLVHPDLASRSPSNDASLANGS